MCSRYEIDLMDPGAFRGLYGVEVHQPSGGADDPLRRRYNVAPTTRVPVIRQEPGRERQIIREAPGGGRELVMARWGLVPAWAKDRSIGVKAINARAEGIADKPMFRAAYKSRRCIVPASGFYEWRRLPGGKKQPYLIRRRDGQPLSFAGLWEEWKDRATGELVTSCTIVTCGPNELMAELHDRMPVILGAEDIDAWLAVGGDVFLRPCPAEWLEAYPVSTRVNNVRNDDPGLIEPMEETDFFN